MTPPGYAELQAFSNFSFLEGASHAEELATTAAALGLAALAVTDRNSLAGVVRAHRAAKTAGLRLVVGARLDLVDAPSLLAWPIDRAGYGRLSQLLSLGRRRAEKGQCRLFRRDLPEYAESLILSVLHEDEDIDILYNYINYIKDFSNHNLYINISVRFGADDSRRLAILAQLAGMTGLPLLAGNDVRMHAPERRPLLDVLTCIRHRCTIDQAGYRLLANAERHLKPPAEMARLLRAYPEALARTLEVVARTQFSLDQLRYEYPIDPAPDGLGPDEALARRTRLGAAGRYPQGVPAKVEAMLAHELGLIRDLGYAPYFLTVDDIVRFARGRGILCQGRGSAANSAVCYCLGITAIDPVASDLLFERFISAARDEPPDIDVDFEHERREEVIQHIYASYGRERAGLAATVISYRPKSALRDVGKAMGLSLDAVGLLSRALGSWRSEIEAERLAETGLDPAQPRIRQTLDLARQLQGFPRHLSQHVGGFVITRGRLDALVPIENAAMAERTVIQWDKDDIDALGILKIDVLGLGMLSCIRKGLDLLALDGGQRLDLAQVPAEDPAVYAMLCRGDSVGVFQVESRAQMAMLPRLKPRCFYDLVIEVAIVRPGPIQGDMVHPYLRRRDGLEAVEFPSAELRQVLGKTLGVPLFQEQAMKIAIVAAGFTPAEADSLRRAMATFRKTGLIGGFRDKMIAGMIARGYERDFAERCFRQIEGFGEYGFPESHAASFALLVYVSAWLKCRHPAVFACALLNSQPMGFYAPAQIVRDAREHGVPVRPVDVNASAWDCTLERDDRLGLALRLGLRQVRGLNQAEARRLVAARGAGYGDAAELVRRAGLAPATVERLAKADALGGLGLGRRPGQWAARALPPPPLPLFAQDPAAEDGCEPATALPAMPLGQEVIEDYASLRLSLKAHPMALLRRQMADEGWKPCAAAAESRHGQPIRLAGIVLVRQRPGTAKGIVFVTLEDETGVANLVVWPDRFARFRRPLLAARLLGVRGRVERQGLVIHVIADRLEDLSPRLGLLAEGARGTDFRSRDFR
ncbi:MAG: DNA polymerase III subunit alpha [Alphaproteobacteria bacterium]|nr:DNA polymerase III subunit alpha [Alphaproteobacteria bacterium]